MATREGALRAAYTELAKSEKAGDWERALKASNRILKLQSHEVTAVHCKIVCFIQLSKFEEALNQIKKAPKSLVGSLEFEKAYCEYRLNQTETAVETLEANGRENLDFRSKELLAQLLYRLEKFDECQRIYKSLLKESEDDFDLERQANLLAVEAQLKDASPTQTEMSPFSETYEQFYNQSCCQIADGNIKKAMKSLNKAESLCREVLQEEGAGEDEIEDEVGLILAQKAYCSQVQGEIEKASSVYSELLRQKPSDNVLAAVVCNNAVSTKKGEQINLFDTRKKLKTCTASGLEQKLTKRQKRTILFNNALLQLHSNQYEPCRKGVEELKKKYGNNEDILLLEISLLTRQKDVAKGIEILQNQIKAEPKSSNSLKFALAQLFLSEGKTGGAMEILNEMGGVKWTPAIISLMVAIHLGLEDKNKAKETLAAAVEHFKKNQPSSEWLEVMVEHCANLHAQLGDQKSASAYLEDLRRMKPNDPKVLARLIQAYSQWDSSKAEEVCNSLPPMERMSGESDMEDVDTLEDSGWILLGEKYRQKKEAKTPKMGEGEDEGLIKKRKKRKKRKTKLPKNIDPNNPPDPERWLPKFERSTFKKKKDKRKADRDIGRGTQGAVGGGGGGGSQEPEKRTSNPTSPKAGTAPSGGSSAAPAPGPRQQRPGQKQKKQKKKGNKW